jgi:hypothetical protein
MRAAILTGVLRWSPSPLHLLCARERQLTTFGLTLLALAVLMCLAQLADERTFQDVSVWVKPAKFALSIGVFALTAAWFFGYVRPERRQSALMRLTVAVLIAAGGLELLWITVQAARAQGSHYNTATPFTAALYPVMGVVAVLLIGTTLALAWEIGRRPARGLRFDFVLAVVTGLVLTFLLGGVLGGYMSAQTSHAVGAEGGGTPFFGWNRMGGDLRIAHFMGIHAMQAVPLLGALVAPLRLPGARLAIVAGATVWTAATLLLFAQAVSGQPLWPL